MAKVYTISGMEFVGLKTVYEYFKVKESTIKKYRAERGLSLEDAVLTAVEYRENSGISLFGKKFKNIEAAYSYYGVSSSTVCRNRRVLGMCLEDAFKAVLENKNTITILGKEFNSLKQAEAYYKVTHKTIKCLVDTGSTLEDAFIEATKGRYFVTVLGVDFKMLKEAYEYFGVTGYVVNGLRKKGMSLDDAFTKAIEKFKPTVIKGYICRGSRLSIVNSMGFDIKKYSGVIEDVFNKGFYLNTFKSNYVTILKRAYKVQGIQYFLCILGDNYSYLSSDELLVYILECLHKDGKIERVEC